MMKTVLQNLYFPKYKNQSGGVLLHRFDLVLPYREAGQKRTERQILPMRRTCYIWENMVSYENVFGKEGERVMQILLFALVGFSSALVNLGIYNLVLWGLQALSVCSGFDFLVAQFFSFVVSVAWAFFFNRRYVFRMPNASWKESLLKVYLVYSITGIGLSSILSVLWVHGFGLPKEVVTLLNDSLCFPVNFLLNKYWSFRKK